MDEAGAKVRIDAVDKPDAMHKLQQQLTELTEAKDQAITALDFEKAALGGSVIELTVRLEVNV